MQNNLSIWTIGLAIVMAYGCGQKTEFSDRSGRGHQDGSEADATRRDSVEGTQEETPSADATATVEVSKDPVNADSATTTPTSSSGSAGQTDQAGSGEQDKEDSGTVVVAPQETSTDSSESPTDGTTVTSRANESDAGECKKAAGGSAPKRLMYVSETNDQVISSDSIAVVKVTGNQSRFTLNVNGAEGTKLASLCVIVTGNLSNVRLAVNTGVEHLIYVARGNQANLVVDVAATGSVGKVTRDIKGNGGAMAVQGAGSFPEG